MKKPAPLLARWYSIPPSAATSQRGGARPAYSRVLYEHSFAEQQGPRAEFMNHRLADMERYSGSSLRFRACGGRPPGRGEERINTPRVCDGEIKMGGQVRLHVYGDCRGKWT